MKIIRCQGKNCKKNLKPRFHSIWFLGEKEYCQECYLKLFSHCRDCNTLLKGKEFKIYSNDVVCLNCYKIRKAVLKDSEEDQFLRTPFGLINSKIATSRSKSNKKNKEGKLHEIL